MSRPMGSREVSIKQIKQIVELSDEGWNRADISKEVGVSKRTVYTYQKGFGFV